MQVRFELGLLTGAATFDLFENGDGSCRGVLPVGPLGSVTVHVPSGPVPFAVFFLTYTYFPAADACRTDPQCASGVLVPTTGDVPWLVDEKTAVVFCTGF